MIIFHEGMPRSGKSFAATKDHIVPALKAGRRCYVRIDGIDFAKLAELAAITEDRCRELLTELTEEDVQHLPSISIENDSLVVLDELQNYWPAQKAALSPEMTKWVAEHGHHGLDVLCMGQLLKDCHRTWVNRTNRKIQFVKKDMLGKPDDYKWRMFTGSPDSRGNVKFVEVQQGDGTYDPAYFGCYKSHSAGTENKGTYVDDRANIFKSAMFRKWLPILGVCVLSAIGYIIYLFSGGLAPNTPTAKPVKVVETVITNAASDNPTVKEYVNGKPVTPTVEAKEKEPEKERPKIAKGERPEETLDLPDVVAELTKNNRIRLALIVRTAKRTRVIIEWRDTSFRVVDQMDNDDLEMLGYHVLTSNNNRLVVLTSPDRRLVASAWPVDEVRGQQEETKDNIRRGVRRDSGIAIAPRVHDPAPDEMPLGETAKFSAWDAKPETVRAKWNF